MHKDFNLLRTTFNTSAGWYDRVRPSYPEALIEDVIGLSAIPEGGQILEIGCGAGKATGMFASRGYAMLCLEIGTELAAGSGRDVPAHDHPRPKKPSEDVHRDFGRWRFSHG